MKPRSFPRALALVPAVLAASLGLPAHAAPAAAPLADKTLVAWVVPASLEQRGGSVLTIEKGGGVFDGIVFGELSPATWMPGSDGFRRTKRDQAAFPREMAPGTATGVPVQVAVAYKGREVSVYRGGVLADRYVADGAETFGDDSKALLGLRHVDAMAPDRYFVGAIDDARIYGVALDAAELAALKPNEEGPRRPVAWWDFEDGRATDRMGTFPATTLYGGARIAAGRLLLGTPGAFAMATREAAPASSGPGGAEVAARALRERLLADPWRPGYHFVIPEGTGMPFDPNGAVYWKGRYHLFYIFQDARGHNWGHVSSTDLFHWRHHPTGLVSGMFSGNCFVNHEGRPTMCYHQVGQGNALAVALDDDLNEWKKLETNPITPRTNPGDPFHGKYRSWDPYGWIEGGTYYAIFGGEHPGVAKAPGPGGPWTYAGDLMANAVEGVSINEDVSCADFFELGGRRVLLCISHRLGARYYVGDWKGEQFHPVVHERMSWADNGFFAPESLLDDRGRRIMWSWIFDEPGFKMRTEHGWSGTMSLPRVLSLGGDLRLRMDVPAEIERLRYNGVERGDVAVAAEGRAALDGVRGNSLELRFSMTAPGAREFGVEVCASPGGEETTRVYYDAAEKKLKVDTTRSSTGAGHRGVEGGPLELAAGEALDLRVFVDKSVVEVFANGRQAVMRRIYPTRADSVGVALFSKGAPAKASAVRAWQMSPSNAW